MTRGTDRRTRSGSGVVSLVVAAVMLVGALLAVRAVYLRTPPSQPTAATTTATPAAGTDAAAPSAPVTSPGAGVDAPVAGALTAEALLTPEDLAGAGIVTSGAVARDEPALPLLCGQPWRQSWGGPAQDVGHDYPATGAAVTEHAAAYADPASADQGLTRLVTSAQTCSAPASGSITVESRGTGPGDDSAVLRYDDGGVGGSLAVTWAVAVRSADRVLLVTYTSSESIGTGSGPGDGGDDAGGDSPQARATAEAIAVQALARLHRAAGD